MTLRALSPIAVIYTVISSPDRHQKFIESRPETNLEVLERNLEGQLWGWTIYGVGTGGVVVVFGWVGFSVVRVGGGGGVWAHTTATPCSVLKQSAYKDAEDIEYKIFINLWVFSCFYSRWSREALASAVNHCNGPDNRVHPGEWNMRRRWLADCSQPGVLVLGWTQPAWGVLPAIEAQ